MSEIIPKGLWFEELAEGLVVRHPLTRTITESDNVQFTVATMNPAPLHLDAAYAETTQFGQVIVNSMFTIALVVGLSVHELTHGTTVANLGFEKVNFPAPVFHGDTIRVESEVLEARPSKSQNDRGIVTFEHRGYNQDDVLVCIAVRQAMMHRRPS